MLNKLKEWFGCGEKLSTLEKENAELKEKLQQRQEVINQTNAYWKRKMYLLKKDKN